MKMWKKDILEILQLGHWIIFFFEKASVEKVSSERKQGLHLLFVFMESVKVFFSGIIGNRAWGWEWQPQTTIQLPVGWKICRTGAHLSQNRRHCTTLLFFLIPVCQPLLCLSLSSSDFWSGYFPIFVCCSIFSVFAHFFFPPPLLRLRPTSISLL